MKAMIKILFLIAALTAPCLGAEVSTIGDPKVAATSNFTMTGSAYGVTVLVAIAPPGPRDFMGLYVSSAPTAMRLDWLYFDGTKVLGDGSKRVLALTFPPVSYYPDLEARIYRWMPGVDMPHELLLRIPVKLPPPKFELRVYESETYTITRVPIGNRDEVRLRRQDGVEQRYLMDRGVMFDLVTIDPKAAPATPAVSGDLHMLPEKLKGVEP